jgi:methyl-accepting chemotaxis protein
MFQRMSVRRKLMYAILICLLVFIGLFGSVAVGHIHNLTRNQVHADALSLVRLSADRITTFLTERGRVVTTMLGAPSLLDWFDAYEEVRTPLEDNPEYVPVHRLLTTIQSSDPTILSAFFAVNATGEYFRESGRIRQEGYDARQRPWWTEALQMGTLYATPPDFDAVTGDVSVTIQAPVYRDDGSLIGIGGVDVLLSTIGRLVESITLDGEGTAFLVEANGNLVYFPELDERSATSRSAASTQVDPRSFGQPLASLDSDDEQASGFEELAAQMERRSTGLGRVQWQGKSMVVLFAPVRSDAPRFDWSLGLMVPATVISSPVRQVTIVSVLGVVVAIALICSLVVFLTSVIVTTPVQRMVEVTTDLADGNLGRRVTVERLDEIGVLGQALNRMADQIEHSAAAIHRGHDRLERAVQHLKAEGQGLTQRSQEQVEQVGDARDAMTELTDRVDNVASSANTLSESSEETSSSALELVASMEEVASSAESLQEQVEETSTATLEMVSAIQQVGNSASTLNSFVHSTTAAMRQQEQSLKEAQDLASLARELSGQVVANGEEGKAAVQAAMDAIVAITDTFRQIHSTVERLSTSSERIGSIIEVIEDVSNQTHLLSLNASILAAQAGEEGKGFGVVAWEIRDLAERTGAFTHEVAELIRSVQRDVNAVTGVTQEGARRVDVGSDRSQRVVSAFGTILTSATRNADVATQIAQTTQQQAQESNRVGQAVEQLATMAEQVTQAVSQQETGSGYILQSVEEMRRATQQVREATVEQRRASIAISHATEQVMAHIRSIREALQFQTERAHMVANAMDGVVERSRSNSATAESLVHLVGDLDAEADRLEKVITRLGHTFGEATSVDEPTPPLQTRATEDGPRRRRSDSEV